MPINKSIASPSKCPPFINTYLGPILNILIPAIFISSTVFIFIPVISSASGTFGVTMYAIGIKYFIRLALASGFNKLYPLFEIITGSTTRFSTSYFFKVLDISSIISGLDTIPIFVDLGFISSNTTSICFFIIF
ncbi:hypothetical protein SDC9_108062 [bioreactor metagenome]|uniref:Uncharacterized protein n=1 Tax=bioreactor metagenome TaxID=1076179 RepID=A0A645B6Z9_9ZZZZ